MKQKGFEVVSSDIIDRGAQDFLADFLKCEEPFDGDILTNPPYKYAEQFVLKALELAKGRVFMFLKLTYLEGKSRYERIYKEHPPRRVCAFPKRALRGEGERGKSASGPLNWLSKRPRKAPRPPTDAHMPAEQAGFSSPGAPLEEIRRNRDSPFTYRKGRGMMQSSSKGTRRKDK